MSGEPKFLLVRFGAIGDCVMAAWAATSIREKYPMAEIAWAVESRCVPVIESSRLVTCLHQIPKDRWKAGRWSPTIWREQVLSYSSLRKRRFDFGIDLQGHSKTAICLRLASPRVRIAARGTDPLARSLNPTLTELADRHTIEWNQEALRAFEEFDLPVRPIMPEIAAAQDLKKITLSVGAGHASKKYPAEGWREVASLFRKAGYRVHALGGPEERGLGDDSVDLVGKLSLGETLQEVATSALHLAADTGTGHIASAYQIPVVSVFGPMNPAKYRPYGQNVTVLRESNDPGAVKPESIVAAGQKLLEETRERRLSLS